MNWMQVEQYLQRDDRAILPLGSTEQHSHLRLTVDCILPERVAVEAAEPLGIPVFPVVPYGVTPYFREFPGTISLRVETHLHVVGDILDGMAHSGFRRILIVNGHGGNAAVHSCASCCTAALPPCPFTIRIRRKPLCAMPSRLSRTTLRCVSTRSEIDPDRKSVAQGRA